MAESCIFKPTVRNLKTGEEVESKLFNSLLAYSSNDREFAKKYYFIGTNEDFLSVNSYDVETDENGEITFKSLHKLLTFNVEEEKTIEGLNRLIKAGVKDYDNAQAIADSFNSSSDFSDEYMAILDTIDNGQANVHIVKRTDVNEQLYEENLTNKCLFDRIKQAVNSVGGDVEFINSSYSKYSTENAEKASNGLYNVIFLSRRGILTSDMAESAGHFAVGALGNSSLAQRLLKVCTSEVQQSILGDRYSDFSNEEVHRREAAGTLVGKYISQEVDKESIVVKMARKFINFFKRVFYKLSSDTVSTMKLDARNAAREIARGFLQGNKDFDIENVLNTEESFRTKRNPNEQDSKEVESFKKVLGELDDLANQMAAIDGSFYKEYRNLEADAAIGRLFDNPSKFANWIAVDGITVALKSLLDKSIEIKEMMQTINTESISEVMPNAKKLREISLFLTKVVSINSVAKSILKDTNGASISEDIIKTLTKVSKQLSELTENDSSLFTKLKDTQRELYLTFLKEIYGKDYIEKTRKILFDISSFKVKRQDAQKIPLKKVVDELSDDETFMSRWLSSMADSNDALNQLAYKAKASANIFADKQVLEVWDRLRVLEKEFKKKGIKTNRLLESSKRTNKLTGNYKSKVNWGDWEADYDAFKKKCEAEFLSKESNRSLIKVQREAEFDLFFRPLIKDWHRSHSTFDPETGKYVPRDAEVSPITGETINYYHNPEYDELTKEEKEALWEILDLKRDLDEVLMYQSSNGEFVEVAHTNVFRMPQFKGSTMNRIENLKKNLDKDNKSGAWRRAVSSVLRRRLTENFVEDSEDRDYGSEITQNNDDFGVLSNESKKNRDRIKRVPLYGINKLNDMNDLSTDIFNGLLQYSAMVYNYSATSGIVDVLETGRDVLKKRDVKVKGKEGKKGVSTLAYARYEDFLEAQVYNKYAKKLKFGKLLVPKVAGFFSGLASKMFLGGNVHGAMINLGTGFIEITKEAIAGEYFTFADLRKANAIYFKNLPENLLEAGQEVKNNKVSLFMRKYNIQNDIDTDVREYSTRKSRATRLNPFGDNFMLPYESGDHYMQAMSYLMYANHIKMKYKGTDPKLKDKIISLWDALEVVNIDDENPKAGKKLVLNNDYGYINTKMGDKVEDWGIAQDANLEIICKQINNRMHGIYNKLDKTAFHKKIYGNLVLAMKGYALGFLQRRFATNKQNLLLDKDDEGTMVTFAKVILNMFGEPSYMTTSMRLMLLPFFSKNLERNVQRMGFSPAQYRNMRRNWCDFAFIAMLRIFKLITAKPGGDDDDDKEEKERKEKIKSNPILADIYKDLYSDNYTKNLDKEFKELYNMNKDSSKNTYNLWDRLTGIAYYASSRLYMEQSAYNTPWGMENEQKAVLEIRPTAISIILQLKEICSLMISGEEYKKDYNGNEAGTKKWIPKVSSYIPYYRSLKVWNDPYKASESYEYGRATYK